MEEWMREMVFMTRTINQTATSKYEKQGQLYLGVAKVESLDGKIIGKFCPVFD